MKIIKNRASGRLSLAGCTFLAARAADEMTGMGGWRPVAGDGALADLGTNGSRDEPQVMFPARPAP